MEKIDREINKIKGELRDMIIRGTLEEKDFDVTLENVLYLLFGDTVELPTINLTQWVGLGNQEVEGIFEITGHDSDKRDKGDPGAPGQDGDGIQGPPGPQGEWKIPRTGQAGIKLLEQPKTTPSKPIDHYTKKGAKPKKCKACNGITININIGDIILGGKGEKGDQGIQGPAGPKGDRGLGF